MLATLAFVCYLLLVTLSDTSANGCYQYALADYAILTDDAGQDNSALQFATMVQPLVQ